MTEFKCGKWTGSPPKGQMTLKKSLGYVKDDAGIFWEILSWEIIGKSAAVQVHVRLDFSVGYKVFFPTEEKAADWIRNPVSPTLQEIRDALDKCQWHEPSKGRIQLWLNFE